jgi:hypothetical protein
MRIGLLVGIVSGLVSALLFYSAARGGAVLRPFLLLLIPLPSLVAGLGWGWLSAAAAAIAGAVIVALTVSGTVAIGFILTLGAPSALAAYLSYLSRPDPSDANARQWYPPGRLMAGMALYAGALPVMLLPLVGGSYEAMRPLMSEVMAQFSKRWLPPDGHLSEQALAEQTDWALLLLPAGLAVQWLAACAINLYVAGRIVRASGRLGRDWPDVASLSYPPTLALALGLALVAANTSGIFAVVGTSFFGALLGAYLLAGLALAHFISRRGAPWLVWVAYLGMFFLWPFFMPAMVLAGFFDSTFQLKRRLGWTTAST